MCVVAIVPTVKYSRIETDEGDISGKMGTVEPVITISKAVIFVPEDDAMMRFFDIGTGVESRNTKHEELRKTRLDN